MKPEIGHGYLVINFKILLEECKYLKRIYLNPFLSLSSLPSNIKHPKVLLTSSVFLRNCDVEFYLLDICGHFSTVQHILHTEDEEIFNGSSFEYQN